MSRYIDADILIQDTIQEYTRSKQYRDAIIRMVNKAPTVEPKRGEWLEWIDCEGEVFWKCSACGQVSEASAAGILYKFCPFCGADMRGKDDE